MSDNASSPMSKAAHLLETAAGMARQELRLAKAEIAENLGQAGVGAALVAASAMVGLVAIFVLSAAGVAGIVEAGLPVWLAALIVGGVLAMVSIAFLAVGLSKLKAKRLIPERTLTNIQRDMNALKEAVNG